MVFDPRMISQFAGQLGGGQGTPIIPQGTTPEGAPVPGGAAGGGGPQLPPWLAAIRGGNPLGGLLQRFQGQGGPGGGFNPLAALQARFGGGMGGQGGMQLPPWLAAMRGGGQSPGAGAIGGTVPAAAGGAGVTAAAPAPVGGLMAPGSHFNPSNWANPGRNAGVDPVAIMHQNTQVPAAQPAAQGGAAGNPYGAWSAASRQNFSQARPWDPSAWGGANAAAGGLQNARDIMHQNTPTAGASGGSQGFRYDPSSSDEDKKGKAY